MSTKVLFGFHAVTVRLKTAPQSITEIHVDATRRDARMKQFLARALDAGVRVIEADAPRLAKLCGGVGHQGVVARVQECTADWCRISADGEKGWVQKSALWGVAPGL